MRPSSAPRARSAGPALAFALGLLAGCGNSGGGLPRFDGKAAADAAMAEYDGNGDGNLDAKELAKCPGLKSLANKAGKTVLTAEDLTARLNETANYPDQLFEYPCVILLDGRPLANAEVTLVPEKFMGETRKPAKGMTNDSGTVQAFKVDGLTKAGVPPGVYRIQVTKPGESIPAKFNAQTILGCEVGQPVGAARGGGAPEDPNIRLTSR